jgi:hypothetical protein
MKSSARSATVLRGSSRKYTTHITNNEVIRAVCSSTARHTPQMCFVCGTNVFAAHKPQMEWPMAIGSKQQTRCCGPDSRGPQTVAEPPEGRCTLEIKANISAD